MFQSNFSYDIGKSLKLPQFRSNTKDEYQFFRNLYQIIDIVTLDIESLQYSEKFIAIAVIYLFLGIYLKHFSINEVVREFGKDTQTYTNYYELNVIFNRFLNIFVGFELDDIVDCIYYVSQFYILVFDYTSIQVANTEDSEIVTFT